MILKKISLTLFFGLCFSVCAVHVLQGMNEKEIEKKGENENFNNSSSYSKSNDSNSDKAENLDKKTKKQKGPKDSNFEKVAKPYFLTSGLVKPFITECLATFVMRYNKENTFPDNVNEARNDFVRSIASTRKMIKPGAEHIFFKAVVEMVIEGSLSVEKKEGYQFWFARKMFDYLLASNDVLWALCMDKVMYYMFFLSLEIERVMILLSEYKSIRNYLESKMIIVNSEEDRRRCRFLLNLYNDHKKTITSVNKSVKQISIFDDKKYLFSKEEEFLLEDQKLLDLLQEGTTYRKRLMKKLNDFQNVYGK